MRSADEGEMHFIKNTHVSRAPYLTLSCRGSQRKPKPLRSGVCMVVDSPRAYPLRAAPGRPRHGAGTGSFAEKHMQPGFRPRATDGPGCSPSQGTQPCIRHQLLVRRHPETKKETSRSARLSRSHVVTACRCSDRCPWPAPSRCQSNSKALAGVVVGDLTSGLFTEGGGVWVPTGPQAVTHGSFTDPSFPGVTVAPCDASAHGLTLEAVTF